MKINNLFKILVIGGATLGIHASNAQELTDPQPENSPVLCDMKDPNTCFPTIVDNQCALAAAPGIIQNTIHEILTDEITHSRIGWAELTRSSQNRSIKWIKEYIPLMINEALQTDVRPMLNNTKKDLSEWGILPLLDANKIMEQTIHEVIMPGLESIFSNNKTFNNVINKIEFYN